MLMGRLGVVCGLVSWLVVLSLGLRGVVGE